MEIQVFESANGIELRAKTGSFRAWRHLAAETGAEMKLPKHDGLCPYCGGWRSDVTLENYGKVWCLCKVLERGAALHFENARFSSPVKSEYKLEQLQPWGSTELQDAIVMLVDKLNEWLLWPEKWWTIMGTVGMGKTHMIVSLANELRPWSLYITAGDLEGKVFEGMDKSSDFSLERLIKAVSHTPFLFLDDVGAEYGGDFFKSVLRRVIDFRYQRPSEYVTVVASNLRPRELVEYDKRIADRLLDKYIGEKVLLTYKESWRRHGDTV